MPDRCPNKVNQEEDGQLYGEVLWGTFCADHATGSRHRRTIRRSACGVRLGMLNAGTTDDGPGGGKKEGMPVLR